MSFENSVFINCPFDTSYRPFLRPVLFSIVYLGLEPKISETASSGHIRIEEIKKLIKSAKYSIHDLSRNRARAAGETARFNMPFELGLDLGCSSFGNNAQRKKMCLIIDRKSHDYQKYLSDIAGQDIKMYSSATDLVQKLRDWLAMALDSHLPSRNTIWVAYNEFLAYLEESLLLEGFTRAGIKALPASNFIRLAKKWLEPYQ